MSAQKEKASIVNGEGRIFIDITNIDKFRSIIESVRSTHFALENKSCIESEGFFAIHKAIKNNKVFPDETIAIYEIRLIVRRKIIDYLRAPRAGREWLLSSDHVVEEGLSDDLDDQMDVMQLIDLFTPQEKRFLLLKLEGSTDDEIAKEIRVTTHGILKIKSNVSSHLERIIRERGMNVHLLPERDKKNLADESSDSELYQRAA